MDVKFRILGPLEVTGESGPISLGGPKQRGVLAILLLRANQVVPVEQLADELYDGAVPATASTYFALPTAAIAARISRFGLAFVRGFASFPLEEMKIASASVPRCRRSSSPRTRDRGDRAHPGGSPRRAGLSPWSRECRPGRSLRRPPVPAASRQRVRSRGVSISRSSPGVADASWRP
jgi:hypothetical protein